MFYVCERDLGELILKYARKITLPKSVSNQLGNVFVPIGIVFFSPTPLLRG